MTALRIAGMTAAISALALAGCSSSPNRVDTSGGAYREVSAPIELVARADPEIRDLPVPIGFDMDEGRSRNFAGGGARYVDHLYKGGADKFAVSRFYERHMPINRWVLVTRMFVQGAISLDFQKETEACRVTVEDGGLFHKSNLKIQLWTTGRIETPATKATKGKPRS